MSRVLARPMFKKKAPKRSAKGVGITSMLEDDVPGYAEGGEVNDDRTERERMAQMLLEQGREEYQRFSEGERPQMTRLPATMGVMPQPNPQQMQAAQMQQMAQMGMLPRFQEGGFVQRQPLYGWGSRLRGWSEPTPPPPATAEETPSIWSRIGSTFKEIYGGNPPLPEGLDSPTPVIDARVNPFGLGFSMSDMPLPEGGGRNLVREIGPSDITQLPGALLGRPQFSPPAEPLPSVAPMRSESAEVERERRAAEPKKGASKKEAPPLPPAERKASDLTEI